MREWGHQHIYDFNDLKMVGNLAGFLIIRQKQMNESDFPELRNLEHRLGSLVVEFIKENLAYREELPLVSICIPAYNPRFFREALLSALNQEYLNLEVIVSDDSLGEDIQNIVVSLHDERIHYYKNVQNIGSWRNYLQCLAYAQGKYVKYLNDDDYLHPACVKTMVSYFEAYGITISLVTSKRSRVDEKGGVLPDTVDTQPLAQSDVYISGRELGNLVLTTLINVIGEPTTVMFRKDDAWDFQEHFETFYDGQPGIGDVVQWLALLRKGDAIYIAQPLSFFRQHSEQAQRNPQKIFYLVRSWYYLITRSRTLGYLQEPLLYREALIHLVQTLERWLQVFPFVEQQRELLRHLITKA
ncbi:MAG: glycosyltransferase family 2 protein, partial [Candidatus Kryptoniota bacterium]